MSLFGKKSPPAERASSAPAKGAPPVGGLSIVGAGMLVRGDLESNGVVKVEGTVEGHVRAHSQVLVAKGGAVHGDIETTEAVVGGTVSGAIRAGERVEVQAGASVDGDITTRRISVAEGGSLNGLIRMSAAPAAAADSATEAKASLQIQTASVAGRPSSVPLARIAVPPRAAT
jgi:cytoskeletal protein CcmA (bactofilin family)